MELLKFSIILSLMILVSAAIGQWNHFQQMKKQNETQDLLRAALKKFNTGTVATKVKATTTVKKKPVVKKPNPEAN